MPFNLKRKCIIAIASLSLLSSVQAQGELSLVIGAVEKTQNEATQISLLKGIVIGLRGLKGIPAPKAWNALRTKLLSSNNVELKRITQQLSQQFGSEEAMQDALALVFNKKAQLPTRKAALKSLSSKKYAKLLPKLSSLFGTDLEKDAIRTYSFYSDSSIPTTLMKHYRTFDIASRQAVIETLATRKEFALEIVKSLKKKTIKKNEIPAYTARNLKSLLGKKFTAVYGDTQKISGDKTKLIAKYKAKLNSSAFAKADAKRGRAIFNRTCAACHKMFDFGGIIGPDLTGSNRGDQDYILLNIIDPSFDVPEAYRMVTIKKKDGQILVGNIVAETAATVELKMVGIKTTISKPDIISRSVSKVSMMPEGLLSTLKDKEFLDLIKYLQTNKQVEAAQ
jgi:putative heme-binding domain-containing protein